MWKDDDPHHADHGDLGRESRRTTLVLRGPGIAPGAGARPVRTIDLVPTVLDLAGIDLDRDALDGRSPSKLLRQAGAVVASATRRP